METPDELSVDADNDDIELSIYDGGGDSVWIDTDDGKCIHGARLNGETVELLAEWIDGWLKARGRT